MKKREGLILIGFCWLSLGLASSGVPIDVFLISYVPMALFVLYGVYDKELHSWAD